MIIDSHCHVIATDTKRYPLKPLFGKQSDWSAEHPLDYPDMIEAIDAAGVDKAILVQASSAYAFDNTYVIRLSRPIPTVSLACSPSTSSRRMPLRR